MATNFPNNLDNFVNPQAGSSVANPSHSQQHADANDAIEALQAKVGVDNSAVSTTLDYRVRALETASLDAEGIQDIVGAMVSSNTETNIVVEYDDTNGKLNFATGADVVTVDNTGFIPNDKLNIDERIQDTAALMITSATHSNITVSYDDNTGRLSFTGIPLTQEQIQDFVAPLLTHSLHTNITATYDDAANKIILEGSGGGGGSGTGGSLTNSWWLGS